MKRPHREALDARGLPLPRPAAVVGELRTAEERRAALESATLAIARQLLTPAQRRIGFGTPVHVAFGMSRQQAKGHVRAELLLTKGDAIPLDYCSSRD